ncbi:MAG: bifunctional 4-hydroxy-2-oxoglutarate aldolase/2-dehydro-3-deoxy-phosphogluconate aldolase [Actinomycetales bacterium]|jgi:2-dehydro-3-deoxyphosphogluconate aldolase/(4S)-4-hydroxy-2-oxoglutarate aldolase|uniref:Bifunctional 4-hydroxy-2-oxoglutarate aldolase/2-dehydro-3-deoxy-phosphogluconate aldolase n=1 Tax=Candidatus Phosphoribacter hodrii TaxID=2953743 RepID=A0A935IMZ0_9MICO|nr:bifunctional 4-hydroxy-2-oxoglutarate aldolase/2-dehydro-3-deoxy-phosphogluconate aldolase [Candidatus Phosphoribacter hodrii]HBX80007.1 aldolase [Propionibacteriaceae bacterium]HBY24749.1 aldolase [Propionibacteriaceae bacterium]
MTELTSAELRKALRQEQLVAILRGPDPGAVVRAGRVLVECGVRILEISLSSTDALISLEELANALAGSDAVLGAGTVIAPGDAARSRDAGAAFAVTPALGPGVHESVELGVPVLAGALTPTEVLAAYQAGASAVKVFPAGLFGPNYFRDLSAPFPDVPLVAVGGVAATQVRAYLDAGALAVGVASPLLGDAPAGGNLDALRSRASVFLSHVRPAHA